jgi:PAS domain S-box-containing protein
MELTDDLFKLLVESVEDYAIYLLDTDGTVRSWNAGAQRLKGCTSREVVGRSFAQFFAPTDRELGRPARLLEEALRSNRVEDVG